MQKLDKFVQVHNILEERNVGKTNYELKILGKENLNTVSRKVELNKCRDLLENATPNLFKRYKIEALVIKDIKYNWNEQMKAMQEKGYNEKEILNRKKKWLSSHI